MNVRVLMGQVLFSYKSLFLRRTGLLKNHKTDDSRISYTDNNDYYYIQKVMVHKCQSPKPWCKSNIRLKINGAPLKLSLFTFYGNMLHNYRIFLHVINNI